MTGPVLRPLSMGEILDVSFGMYRALFTPLLLVTIATQAIPMLISVYVQTGGGPLDHLGLVFFAALLGMILKAVAQAASTFIISESYMGRRITAGEAFQRATPFTGRLILLAILTSFIVGLGLVLFLIPGLILLSGLALASPAMVIEGIGNSTDAMGRAWSLSRGHRFKIFGAIFVTGVLILLPSVALGGFAAVSSLDPTTAERGISAVGLMWQVVASGLQVLIYPLLYCVLTVAYYDLRVRKEAFDLEVLAAGLSRA